MFAGGLGVRREPIGEAAGNSPGWARRRDQDPCGLDQFEDNVPDVTSPLSNGELVFMVTTSGMLTCLDAKDGKKLWDHDYETEFHASPSLAGNRLYLFSQKGTAVVVEAARHSRSCSARR